MSALPLCVIGTCRLHVLHNVYLYLVYFGDFSLVLCLPGTKNCNC